MPSPRQNALSALERRARALDCLNRLVAAATKLHDVNPALAVKTFAFVEVMLAELAPPHVH